MKLDNILDVMIAGENGYESKIKYIIASNKEELNKLRSNEERVNFFINHFVLTDNESKQLKSFLRLYGSEGFLKLVEKIILRRV